MDDLITAAQDEDVGRLRQLLENRKAAHHGSSEEQNSSDSLQKACQVAARNNNPAALEILLKEGGEIERATISAAAYSGSITIFKLLISRGWDVNEPLGHPGDALLMAIGADNVDLAQFLIAHGANPKREP